MLWMATALCNNHKLTEVTQRMARQTRVSKFHCNEQTDDDAWASFLHLERLERRRETLQ